MRIAYGVMGYGRGHAMRSLSVLPQLMQEHEVTVFTAGDAYDVLAPLFPTVRIPMIGYRYNERGQHSLPRTVGENAGPLADLLLGGPGIEQVQREFRDRGIQLVISDSEAWCHRAAEKLKLPRISFDHVGIIAWCKPHFPADLWLTGMRDAIGYRALMGQPDRTLISSFYPAEPRHPGTRIVGPMLRDEVLRASAAGRPASKDYLLAYFNKGEHQYRPQVERALQLLDHPVVVYGTPRRGRQGNIEYRAPSNEWFINDLAQCRAVISTAGNQLIGEAIHFGKPILALPEQAFEQRLNACMIERMGVGMRGDIATLTPSDIDRFLGNEAWYRSHMHEHARDGRKDAIETLHRYIGELVRQPRRSKAKPRTGRRVSRAQA
ncbi:conserved hypothetical protein [Hydrocarboniphaga daqingensis]|uniref:Uncharacterized protein n=1 Tax=Hydrocarboniphaga daqingensis TaxID=490188 RepID=A0A1M5N948_9GAMM|nr:glycosyltransferase family protein [Hydrocarboniphaga daqingensis]SHG86040.1 conserved hypothetical protein [Hydrocarboniphaga daqingensis]